MMMNNKHDSSALRYDNPDDLRSKADGPARRLFWQALKDRMPRLREVAIASVVVNMTALASSLFSMQVYDRVIPNNAHDTLWVLFVGAVLAFGIEAVLRTIRSNVLSMTTKGMELELGQAFFNKALSIRMDARPNTVGTFAAQIRDFDSVKNFFSSTTLYAMSDAPFAFLFIGVIFMLGGPIAFIPLAALPVAILAGYMCQRPMDRLAHDSAVEGNMRSGMLIESVDGAESIKATGGEGWFSQRWYALSASVSENALKMRELSSLASTLSNTINQLCYAALIVAGAYSVQAGHMTMGALIASAMLINRVVSPFSQLTSVAINWHQAKQALSALNDMMSRPNVGPEPGLQEVKLDNFTPSFRLENIRLIYGQDRVIGVEVPSLSIATGERVAILGPSGSGKTSLLKILTGLYKPSEGRVFASGVDLQLLNPDLARSHIGYLPQDVRLFNGTLKENLCIGIKPPSDDDLLAVCAVVGLSTLVTTHPRGINLLISEGGRGLSGGQKQMVALARVLLQKPSVLLLDEPTASLDSQGENELLKRLKDYLTPQQTLVIVTHKTAPLALVDRIMVVTQGKVVIDGPRDAVWSKLTNTPLPFGPSASQPVSIAAKGDNGQG